MTEKEDQIVYQLNIEQLKEIKNKNMEYTGNGIGVR